MNQPIDLRSYRPAAVIVIDLVHHSTRDKLAVHGAQTTLEQVLESTKQQMKLDDCSFNYTGDGYVCALAGESSARLFDFLNMVVPELRRRLERYEQAMRIGIDFGLIHLSKNSLTGKNEYFNTPSIQAARLEQAAKAGQILCTETVQLIFGQHYGHMLSKESLQLRTKDRELRAFEVSPVEVEAEVRKYLANHFFELPDTEYEATVERNKFLVVDDESSIVAVLEVMLRSKWPNFGIVVATSARKAIKSFRPGEFAAVFADMIMPEMDGLKLTRHLTELDAELPVIMVSAIREDSLAKAFFAAGGSYLLLKPFERDRFFEVTRMALACPSLTGVRRALCLLCDDMGAFLLSLDGVAARFRSILHSRAPTNDKATALLRHQAKHAVTTFISGVGPGADPRASLAHLSAQLECIARLAAYVSRTKLVGLEEYVKDVISDFRTLHPGIRFALNCSLQGTNLDSIRDGSLLVLVMSELIENAISALEERGRIEIGISVLRGSGSLQLTVRDSGPGVPENLVGTIFDEGISTKGPGRGLGLFLVRSAILTLGGQTRYDFCEGARFCVVIPGYERPPGPVPSSA